MEKYPFTYAYLIAIAAAFLGEFGRRGLDAMSGAIIQLGWCTANNNTCLFVYQLFVLVAILGAALTVDRLIAHRKGWSRVTLSEWLPYSTYVIGGIIVHNNSSVDLEDCEVDLLGFDDDLLISHFAEQAKEFVDHLEKAGDFPARLFWDDGRRELKPIVNIGRGKEGYIMLLSPLSDNAPIVTKAGVDVLRKPSYQIKTDKLTHVEPFLRGWLYLRIIARVKGNPLPLMRIAVRVEVEDDTPVIKEIIKGKMKE